MTVEIALRAAHVRYGPLEALHGVDLAVPAAHLTVLLGRNGAGRTTALRALAGTVPLTSGSVVWGGEDVTRLAAYARARRGACLVPDRGAVFATLTVAENLRLAARAARDDPEAAPRAFPALGALLPRRAGTLSGGEQRMLAVARALLSPARLLLLDEPTQGMSPEAAARTYGLLADAVADGRTVVVAEQRLPGGAPGGPDAGGVPHGSAAGRAGARLPTVVVYELRRGAVVFSGEAAEWRSRAGGPASSPGSAGSDRGR
ncbi:ATP-binding cassette domain-containing protein [Streptomyces sp. LX-29]|uniref:ATP-binding cassette domain-containing protein n=1 Tax=Streptomyces sp. LX-29 TaxID=2900152 RepID=UPI00240E7381|nr:ATP-binding cassette domain-containing protein [Streptomyces sp. LX-29]WFB11872.1 ATP-binding cassette domain-containing protein [Streptomyces sp. LX-29]